jgi:hypothetical protein
MSDNIDLEIQVVDGTDSGDSPQLNHRLNNGPCHRAAQRVSSVLDRKTVAKWMIAEVENAGIEMLASKAVRNFPKVFGAHDDKSTKAALMKAGRWWKSREGIVNAAATTISRAGRPTPPAC